MKTPKKTRTINIHKKRYANCNVYVITLVKTGFATVFIARPCSNRVNFQNCPTPKPVENAPSTQSNPKAKG